MRGTRTTCRAAAVAAAGLFGGAWLVWVAGARVLDPTDLGWMMEGDRAVALIGWLFFRHAAWQLPLGAIPDLLAPVGTSLAFTAAVSWVGLALRPLAPLLPVDWHYFGYWLLLCFVLQGVFGALVVRRFSSRPLHVALGGALFAVSPVLALRLVHPHLCGQWLILWLLWLHLAPAYDRPRARRAVAGALLACLLAVGVDVYLTAMTLALIGALLLRLLLLDRALSAAGALAAAAAAGGLVAGGLALLGILGTGVTGEATGFGIFAADLLTLVIPLGSRFSHIRFSRSFFEGYGYLGAGILALCAIGLGAAIAHPRRAWRAIEWRRWALLLAAAIGMAAFALSDTIHLAGREILQLPGAWLLPLGRIFRASGRFVWPLHYAVVALAVAAVLRLTRQRPRWGSAALALALALQIGEFGFRPPLLASPSWTPPSVRGWIRAAGRFRHLVLVPPQIRDGSGALCSRSGGVSPYYWTLAYLGYRLGTTINSGYVPRLDRERTERYCEAVAEQVRHGELDSETIYVLSHRFYETFSNDRAVCGKLDRYVTCISSHRHGGFRNELDEHWYQGKRTFPNQRRRIR